MATIEFDAPGYHAEITSTSPIALASVPFQKFLEALGKVDVAFNPISIAFAAGGGAGNFSYTLSLPGRSFASVLNPVNQTRSATTGFFSLPELLAHNPMIDSLFGLVAASATKVEVTWA